MSLHKGTIIHRLKDSIHAYIAQPPSIPICQYSVLTSDYNTDDNNIITLKILKNWTKSISRIILQV